MDPVLQHHINRDIEPRGSIFFFLNFLYLLFIKNKLKIKLYLYWYKKKKFMNVKEINGSMDRLLDSIIED